MKPDPDQHLFSRAGSYLVINQDPGDEWNPAGLYLRTINDPAATHHRLFRLTLHDALGEALPTTVSIAPTHLTLQTEDGGRAEFCLLDRTSVRARTKDVTLRMRLVFAKGIWQDAYSRVLPMGEDRWDLECFTVQRRYRLRKLVGDVRVDAPWNGKVRAEFMQLDLGDTSAWSELSLTEFNGPFIGEAEQTEVSFDQCLKQLTTEHEAWQATLPDVAERYRDATELAWWVNASCIVRPAGLFKRPGMLMSKRHMINVWSWDHCFNAMALAITRPDDAWDQFAVMFDRQHESGLLPDRINDVDISWMCTKPPVHGWTLTELIRRNPTIATRDRLDWIRPRLERWTEFWFTHMTHPVTPTLPHYRHGNDSGWDNSTVFASGPCVCSPDLATFLVLQMDALASLAERANDQESAERWRRRSSQELERLLETYWREDRFVALDAPTDHEIRCDSLQLYLPLLLGEKLPHDVRRALIDGLCSRGFLTPHGLATESTRSSRFCREAYDGYWRGPIWAPPTLMFVRAFQHCGENDLAHQVAVAFCDLCNTGDFAENFDPLTGAGSCDRPYTWTSSVFVLLAHDLSRLATSSQLEALQ